uniref:Uncharacterized protein n=1 Tax=Arundo donax TaxID=35708 RepID=A0A0A8ZK58_ARUDO
MWLGGKLEVAFYY